MRIYLRKCYPLCIVLIFTVLLYGVLIRNKVKNENVARKNINIRNLTLPILVMACNRPSVRRCLQSLIRYRPVKQTFPIIVSLYCGHEPTYQIVKSFADQDPTIMIVQPDQANVPQRQFAENTKNDHGIARHYKFALNHVFRTLQYKVVVILEDDLVISPDFYEYFRGTYHLLYDDPTIWCVSAWNDNCKKSLVELAEPALLHRTDFFPGKSWMMQSETWEDLEPNWPQANFDDWLRNPAVSRGRVCIRPEISRTYNFGIYGVSNGQSYYNRSMYYNKEFVLFSRYDLSYLLKEYEPKFISYVYSLPETTAVDVLMGNVNSSWKFVRIPYTDVKTFKEAASRLGLVADLRQGVPRTALHGIVQCFFKGRRVFLARAPKGAARHVTVQLPKTGVRSKRKEVTYTISR